MGRVFNDIELRPYYGRTDTQAAQAPRVPADDRALMTDSPDPGAQDEDDVGNAAEPNPAIPRWQQRIEAGDPEVVEPSMADIQPVAADAPQTQ